MAKNKEFIKWAVENGKVRSMAEGRRILSGGGVRVNGKKISEKDSTINENDKVEIGKKKGN